MVHSHNGQFSAMHHLLVMVAVGLYPPVSFNVECMSMYLLKFRILLLFQPDLHLRMK